MTEKYQVLARKYRPKNFHEVIGQETIVTTLKNALRFQKIAQAYLFCGGRGSGKTTLARLLAKALNCSNLSQTQEPCNQCPSCLDIMAGQSLDVIEIDGASNRGIDDIREINEMVGYVPSMGRYKIYIIDEVHMLTKEAFNALLKTLEEPPAQAKFFFATTEIHKVLPTIISRCQRFDLGRIPQAQIVAKLEKIGQDLGRSATPEALNQIGTLAEGSLRDAESLFDQILCFAEGTITADIVHQVFGLVPQDHFFALDRAFSEYRLAFAFELVESLFNAGQDFFHFMSQLIDHYRTIALCKTLGEGAISSPFAPQYMASSRLYSQQQSLYLLEYLITTESGLQKSLSPRIFLESTLLHIIRSKNRIPVEVLTRRLLELQGTHLQPQLGLEEPMKHGAPLKSETNHPVPPQIQQNKEPNDSSKLSHPKPATQNSEQKKVGPIELEEPMQHAKALQSESNLAAPAQIQENKESYYSSKLFPPTPSTQNIEQKKVGPIGLQEPIQHTQALQSESNHAAPPQIQENKESNDSSKLFPPTPPTLNIEEKKGDQRKKTPPQEQDNSSAKHPSHYDTLMRFAAVELEGSLKN